MSTLAWLFLESTPALAALLFVALFVLLVYWRRTGRGRPLLIGLVAAIGLLIVQAAVVTQREHADRIMARIETDILASRVDALRGALSSEFRVEDVGWGPSEFIDRVRAYLERVDVTTVSRRRLTVVDRGEDTFAVEIGYLTDIRTSDYSGLTSSRWRIGFVRESNGWRISEITPLRLAGRPLSSWKQTPRP